MDFRNLTNKRYRRIELEGCPGSPCRGCKHENDNKLVFQVQRELIPLCDCCAYLEDYAEYTRTLEGRANDSAGDSISEYYMLILP